MRPSIVLLLGSAVMIGGCARQIALAKAMPPSPVDGYTNWTKATKRPVQMSLRLWRLCVEPTPEQQKELEDFNRRNPHSNGYLTVHVNDAGRKALIENNGEFPVGSTIVKEKMVGPQTTVIARTVMKKREKGWRPQSGDWDFFQVDEKLQPISSQSQNCISCHQSQSKNDWVYRTYLTQ